MSGVRMLQFLKDIGGIHSNPPILYYGFKGSGSHLQTTPNIMNFGILDEKYTLMIMCMKSQRYRLKNFFKLVKRGCIPFCKL